MRYAVATGRATSDPTRDLRGALAPVTTTGFASITEPGRLGDLMRAVNTYSGSFIIGCAMRLLSQLFTRPGEMRQAEWSEIDRKSMMQAWADYCDGLKASDNIVSILRKAR